jgi:2-polyprenyl-3-methyl-5-hydroxy-6-metoxy-1,4-benzoquinol methylase
MSTTTSSLQCPADGTTVELRWSRQEGRYWLCPECGRRWWAKQEFDREGVLRSQMLGRFNPLVPERLRGVERAALGTSEVQQSRVQPMAAADDTLERIIAGIPAAVADEVAEAVAKAQPTDESEQLELFYDSIAENFDRIMNKYDLRRRLDTIFNDLLGKYDLRGRTLLDAGCGTGWFSLRAHERGADVTALDIGPKLLEQVRCKCDVNTVCGTVLDLEFESDSFDVVVSSECIEHTRDPRLAVRELVRVCRPGGLIVITCPNHTWYWLCALANRLHLRPYEGLETWPRWSQLRRWVEQGRGHVMEMRGIHLFPFQVRLFQPLLKLLDRLGRFHGRLCVNQAVLAVKLC